MRRLIPAVTAFISRTGTLEDALLALSESTPGGGAPPVPVTSAITVTYVAPNGSDITGQRGNVTLPFLTVQAAINATLNGDVIDVAPAGPPGTFYAENLVVPPARTELTLIGPATLSPATGTALIYNPTGISGQLNLTDITLASRDPGLGLDVAISIDGSGTAGAVDSVIKDAVIGKSTFANVSSVDIENVRGFGQLSLIDSSDASIRSTVLTGGNLRVSYTVGSVRPRSTVFVKASRLAGGVLLAGIPDFNADQATLIEAPRGGPAVDAAALTTSAGLGPVLTVQGTVTGGSVTVGFTKTLGASNRANFSGAEINGDVTVSVSAPELPVDRAQVTADGTVFRGTTTIGESVDLEASSASILGPLVGAGSGAANRPIFTPTVTSFPFPAVGPITVPMVPPQIDATYQVAITPDSGNIPTYFVFNKTAGSYDVGVLLATQTGPGNFDTTVIRTT